LATDFLAFVQGRDVVFADGSTGITLARRGVSPGPKGNVEAPDAVLRLHREYVEAGAQVLLTNTLTANRLALARSGEADRVGEYNRRGAALARQAAGDERFVAGDLTTTGEFLEPYGDGKPEVFHEVYLEQARALAGAGVDLFVIETMFDAREMAIAVKACKEAADLPVHASIAFDPVKDGFRTSMGTTVEQALTAMVEAGADIVGVNCGTVGLEDVLEIVKAMRALTALPIAAEPNAGRPEMVKGELRYHVTPGDFAEAMVRIHAAGARIVGGCCGTAPAHIAAMVGLLS